MQNLRGKLSRALFVTLGLLMGFALKTYGEVKFGDAYDHHYGKDPLESWVGLVRPQSDIGSDVTINAFGADRVCNYIAVEVLGCKDVALSADSVEYIYYDSIAEHIVKTPTILTDAQMKDRVFCSNNEEDGSFLEGYVGGVEHWWEKAIWSTSGIVNEDRKWIVIPISRGENGSGYWGGMPSFSVKVKNGDAVIASDVYYLRTDGASLPRLTGKDLFGLECTQYGGGVGVVPTAGYVTTDNTADYSEQLYSWGSYWEFYWYGQLGETSMTIKVPEAGHLVIRGQYDFREDDAVTEENPWTVSGSGVEVLSHEWEYNFEVIKINCKQATTVTLKTKYLYGFNVDEFSFYPEAGKSASFVPDTTVARRITKGKTKNTVVYLNGYATGGGTYKAGETLNMVAHPAPGFAFDHWEITDQEYWENTSTITFPEGTSTVSETLSFEVPESFCGSMEDEKTIHIRPIFVEANSVPAEGWPEWALGTWAGQVVNYVPDEGKTYDGFYKLTLTSTGTKEKYKWNDEEDPDSGSGTNKLKGWKIAEQENCHVVATCWYWSDSGDDRFDAKYIFCNPDVSCSHYTNKSTYYAKMGDDGDTLNANLAKLEMNTAPAEGWPEWVIGNWTGPLDIWIPDKHETFYGYSVLSLNSTTNQWKVVWDDDDPDREDPLLGWKITEQKDCHIVATAWCWDEDEDRVYDVKCVFRKPDVDCADYAKSFAEIKERNDLKEHNDGECETGTMSLTKDEDNIVPVEGWPEWVIGTWKGDANNWHASSGKYEYGTYELTLTSKGTKEKIVLEGESSESSDDAKGWKITEKAECHIVATAWCWDDEEDDKFDAKYVFRNPNVNCSHYANSSFYQKMRLYGDTVECSNLKKDIRIVCHYTNIMGTVGQELRKPNGDHYFDVDWFDYDSPAGAVSGDNDPDLITESGTWLVGTPSTFATAYTGTNKDESKKEKPTDTQSWYNDWDSYYPIIVTPTKEGVYKWTRTYIWYDGNPGDRTKWHEESITITFDIKLVPTVAATAENVNTVYDGAAHGIEVKVTSPTDGVTVMYSAESAEGPWQSTSPTTTEVGTKRIWYYAVAEEYLGVTNSATVTISPRKISDVKVDVTLPIEGYKYDATEKLPTVTVTDDSLEDFSDSDYEISYEGNVNAGEASVIVTAAGKHYAGAVTNVFTILPRSVTLTSGSKEWAWDGEAKSCEDDPTISGDGFVESEGVTFSDFASVTAPGTYDNTFEYTLMDGTLASNYEISLEYGKLTIYNYKAEVKGDGSIKITGASDDTAKDSDLFIPEEIDGKKITEVGEGAFAHVTTETAAKEIKLSKYVTKIDASAFRGNTNLTSITFADKVYETDGATETKLEIGAYAFSSAGVEEVVIPESVSKVGKYAFMNCKNLKSVKYNGSTTQLDPDALYRSGIAVGEPPKKMDTSALGVNAASRKVTMTLASTGGAINTSNLKILYGSSPSNVTEEIPYTVGDVELTSEGGSVTVTAEAPEGAEGAAFFRAVVGE